MKKNNYHCLTLRIEPQLDEALTEACWEHRMTKAAYCRCALRQSLGLANPMPKRLRKENTQ